MQWVMLLFLSVFCTSCILFCLYCLLICNLGTTEKEGLNPQWVSENLNKGWNEMKNLSVGIHVICVIRNKCKCDSKFLCVFTQWLIKESESEHFVVRGVPGQSWMHRPSGINGGKFIKKMYLFIFLFFFFFSNMTDTKVTLSLYGQNLLTRGVNWVWHAVAIAIPWVQGEK